MYNPPITLVIDEIHRKLMADMDNHIVRAVGEIGISINKYELVKALAYDRNQYDQGYADAELDALNRIVRCKDCKHRPILVEGNGRSYVAEPTTADGEEDRTCPALCADDYYNWIPKDDFFCARGERDD